jgi:hypothetical protein
MADRRRSGGGPSKLKAGLLGGVMGAGQGYLMNQLLDQEEPVSPEERACLLQRGVWRADTASCHDPITGEPMSVLGSAGRVVQGPPPVTPGPRFPNEFDPNRPEG